MSNKKTRASETNAKAIEAKAKKKLKIVAGLTGVICLGIIILGLWSTGIFTPDTKWDAERTDYKIANADYSLSNSWEAEKQEENSQKYVYEDMTLTAGSGDVSEYDEFISQFSGSGVNQSIGEQAMVANYETNEIEISGCEAMEANYVDKQDNKEVARHLLIIKAKDKTVTLYCTIKNDKTSIAEYEAIKDSISIK
ncbi:MAG: hypothetical protein KBS66_00295 [Eubacterium sp.]|nr:hypothetical protein [Candidatus Colimonas fimequi]